LQTLSSGDLNIRLFYTGMFGDANITAPTNYHTVTSAPIEFQHLVFTRDE